MEVPNEVKLDETAGFEFPLNTTGAVQEDVDLDKNDAVAFSARTIEVSDSASAVSEVKT